MSKTLAKIIGYGALILIVVVAFGFIYKFTNGFNEDFKTFYVEYDGKQIFTADSKLTLEEGETHTFIVRYTFDSEKSEPKDYSVKIIPNVERDFDYTVNGEKYIYSKTGEMTAAFNFEKGQAQFSITIPEGFDLQKALASVNSGKTVVVPEDADTNNTYPYTLVVSSYNGKVTYSIDLNTVDTSIILKPDEIVFGDGEENGTPSKPTEQSYTIEYLESGDATNLSDISVSGARKTTVGETVSFTVTIGDSNYTVSGMKLTIANAEDNVAINGNNGSYSFIIPKGNVTVWIYFEYTPPQDITMYSISYDSLGWAGMSVVNLNCPGKAAAGEKVTFTATVKPEFASEYKISGINVNLGSGESYIEDLRGNNGTYTFTMPDTATMEIDGYITLMFYIIPIDM